MSGTPKVALACQGGGSHAAFAARGAYVEPLPLRTTRPWWNEYIPNIQLLLYRLGDTENADRSTLFLVSDGFSP